jgi:hypothetical protein
MRDYRCYFLRPAMIFFGAHSAIDITEEFGAYTDGQARLMAESLYQMRSSRVHGYELWQGNRLVHRHRADATPCTN